MLKNLFMMWTLTASLFAANNAFAAYDVFSCKCVATAPGVDNNSGEKLCSYGCNCTGFNKNETSKENIKVNLTQLATSARSKDTWDFGSNICHGQYAYKPNLSDANWKIQVRFSPFTISSVTKTLVIYEEKDQTVQIANGVFYQLKRSSEAPEIFQALRNQL